MAISSLDEVRRVRADAERDLLKLPGVTGVDVGYKRVGGKITRTPAILVYVKKKRDVPAQEAIPKQIQGIPTDVVERSFELH